MRLLWAAALVLPALGAQAAAVLTTLYAFVGGTDGAGPYAGLVQGSDGNFYGTTEYSSRAPRPPMYIGPGSVFKISTNGNLTTLYSFTGGNDGANPVGGLVQGSDGNFYGTTQFGGNTNLNFGYGYGTVFKISTNGALTTLYSFSGGNDGAGPNGLVQASDGNFYGTTQYGGTNGNGTVFKMSATGAYISLYSFTGGNDGGNPNGLVQGSDGNFYGTTYNGGRYGNASYRYGTAFKISSNGALTTLYAFGTVTNANGYPVDGEYPIAGLAQGSDGNFYGTTFEGGTNGGCGTVFQISTNGVFTSLYSFSGNDGESPRAGLVQGGDGNFYGTTYGSEGGIGTVFRLTIVPAFQAMTLTNGMLSLTWSTEAGARYQLQCNSDLSSSNWTSVGSAFTGTGGTISTTDAVTNGPQRFYRVALVP
jgi:uncharacterized repeat protein (TIGR03803 family)